ncbi:hypothetical protein BC629DRAFT_1600375 [Irpex lacteus]|nr:hypothetical protein BC629DRAFT_1600375 [Irpex lacteus]
MTTPRRPTFPVPVRPIPLHSSSPSDHHHPPTSYKHPSSPSITSITAMLSARPMQPLPIAAPQSPALLSPNVPTSPARPSPQSQHSYSQQPIPLQYNCKPLASADARPDTHCLGVSAGPADT